MRDTIKNIGQVVAILWNGFYYAWRAWGRGRWGITPHLKEMLLMVKERRSPGISWYRAIYACRVEDDLDKNPELIELLGGHKKRFIRWCANQRLIYTEDIFDEVREYLKVEIKKRLYNVNVKE